MESSQLHIIHNGDIIASEKFLFGLNNRAFSYGDSLFETMHAYSTDIQFFDSHYDRLLKGMQALKMNVPENLAKEKLEKEIKRLLNRNKQFGGTRIRLTVFRESEGYYTPVSNEVSYTIQAKSLEKNFYQLNSKGISIDLFTEFKKPVNLLSGFKNGNSLIYVLAAIFAKESKVDESILINENNIIIEGFRSNLFIIKNNILYTPGLNFGCVAGIMREQVLKTATLLNIKIVDNAHITENDLLSSDEIFLTNAIEGIRWVGAFKNRRYFYKFSKLICDQINHNTFSHYR